MILRLWARQRGGSSGSAMLPAAGGLMDQPAYLIAAFSVMDETFAVLDEARRRREKARGHG